MTEVIGSPVSPEHRHCMRCGHKGVILCTAHKGCYEGGEGAAGRCDFLQHRRPMVHFQHPCPIHHLDMCTLHGSRKQQRAPQGCLQLL